MLTLGINTALPGASLAVAEEHRLLGEIFLDPRQPKTETLARQIKKFLTLLDLDFKKIPLISVVKGPGVYTGLRTGLTTAKTLVQVLKNKIVTIDTLENLAFQARFLEGLLVTFIKATQKFFNLALFSLRTGQYQRLTDDLILEEPKILEKLARIKGRFYIATDTTGIYDKILLMNSKSRVALLDNSLVVPNSAGSAAFLGAAKFRQGNYEQNPLNLVPLYLHPVRITPKIFNYQSRT